MNRVTALAAVLLLCAASASAASLGKYKGWESSPEGYFLTASERGEFLALADDAAAESFVNDFRAKRGGEAFVAEVKKRAEMADKYLTIGKVKGSSSLRGKLVILFGAPASISVNDRVAKKGYSSGLSGAGGAELGGGVATRDAEGDAQQLTAAAGQAVREFTFTFSPKDVPAFKGKEYTITVESDSATGKDKLPKSVKQADLDALFEAVARDSIKQ